MRMPMTLPVHCLLSNHSQLLVRPIADRNLSRWMHLFMITHLQC